MTTFRLAAWRLQPSLACQSGISTLHGLIPMVIRPPWFCLVVFPSCKLACLPTCHLRPSCLTFHDFPYTPGLACRPLSTGLYKFLASHAHLHLLPILLAKVRVISPACLCGFIASNVCLHPHLHSPPSCLASTGVLPTFVRRPAGFRLAFSTPPYSPLCVTGLASLPACFPRLA
jgi:hypothetical protein